MKRMLLALLAAILVLSFFRRPGSTDRAGQFARSDRDARADARSGG